MGKFSKKIRSWNSESERRMRVVFKGAAKRVADEANTTQAKRGRLPLDTGFLRASQTAELGEMPSGPGEGTRRGKEAYGASEFVGAPPTVVIAQWTPGDVLYIGWTAKYARYMEYKYQFMQSAAQKWKGFVKDEARRFR